jgi:NAD(P)-dependent dehydrogenase (short-subunit alcohol dehydrogenase family)
VKAEIEALRCRAEIVLTDVSDVAHVRTLMQTAKDTFGSLEILVNNVGWTGNLMALDTNRGRV